MAPPERASALHHKERQEEKESQCRLETIMALEDAELGMFTKDIREIKIKLEKIDKERNKGADIRVRAERLWLGEAPTKRSLVDEKRYAVKNEIKEIHYRKEVVRDYKAIQRPFVEHYRELLGHETRVDYGFPSEFLPLMPVLDDDVKRSFEELISVGEIERAIDELSPGKSPGPGGLGAA